MATGKLVSGNGKNRAKQKRYLSLAVEIIYSSEGHWGEGNPNTNILEMCKTLG